MPLTAPSPSGRRAVRRRAGLLPHVLRPRRQERAGVLPVRERRRSGALRPALTPSPFRHIALATDRADQDAIRARIADAGYVEPQTFVLDHGHCVSLYITDPNGLLLEFTVDDPDADAINEVRRGHARKDLERWLGGDHSSNNTYRD